MEVGWPFGLQVAGFVLESLGLLTVAIGISEIREKFSGQPSWLTRLGRRFDARLAQTLAWLARVLFRDRPPEPKVGLEGIGTSEAVGRARIRRGFRPLWEKPLEQRVASLQGIAQEHEDAIGDLQEALHTEQEDRERADAAIRNLITETEERTKDRIAEAVAGGISREAKGALCFFCGLALSTVGNLIA